mmetsp:Transcript_8173/g.21053  ORF Transcript_8173/g.21053 Transcript_8173/m.21053 type:complete len:210 (-) Transcript_8173:877-1506(-)
MERLLVRAPTHHDGVASAQQLGKVERAEHIPTAVRATLPARTRVARCRPVGRRARLLRRRSPANCQSHAGRARQHLGRACWPAGAGIARELARNPARSQSVRDDACELNEGALSSAKGEGQRRGGAHASASGCARVGERVPERAWRHLAEWRVRARGFISPRAAVLQAVLGTRAHAQAEGGHAHDDRAVDRERHARVGARAARGELGHA